MAKYTEAPEVRKIANELIDKYHPHLKGLNILYLFRDKTMKSRGKEVYGKASKVQAKYKAITGATFIIEIAGPVFHELNYEKQVALIDHELMHCFFDENDKPTILSHDFEGFNKELRRHGFWTSDLEIMKRGLQQMELPFEDNSENNKPDLKVVKG